VSNISFGLSRNSKKYSLIVGVRIPTIGHFISGSVNASPQNFVHSGFSTHAPLYPFHFHSSRFKNNSFVIIEEINRILDFVLNVFSSFL